MPISAGTHLGPYVVRAALGSGGMGEVYRATDTRLSRTVAIKVLRSTGSGDPARRERFEREARAISALNHPHICTLYDVGRHEGTAYLVMEYCDGETLCDRLARRPMRLDEVLLYGIQLAEALAAAHRTGIAHRDVKPSNILLTKGGAKLLDFGLAKWRPAESAASVASTLSDGTNGLSAEGTLLGTLNYMAPEQLEGKSVDARADLFALGAVLYEMTTGRPAFDGGSRASVIAAILTREPTSLAKDHESVPGLLDRLISKCLAKKPEDRWQSADDLAAALRWIAEGTQVTRAGTETRSRRRGVLLAVLGLVLFASAAGVVLWGGPEKSMPEPTVFAVHAPGETTLDSAGVLSPDGRRLAFVTRDREGQKRLHLQTFDSLDIQTLPGTEGAEQPFWSPASDSIGFFAQGKLKRIQVSGGSASELANVKSDPAGGTWSRDGAILFAPSLFGPLYRISASGGIVEAVTKTDPNAGATGHRWPYFLPDGRHFLYVINSGERGVYVGSLDSDVRTRLFERRSRTIFAPPGYLLFSHEGTLMAQRFDPERLQLSGEPVAVAEPIATSLHPAHPHNVAASVSANKLAFVRATTSTQLTWFDRAGNSTGTIDGFGQACQFTFAANAARLSFITCSSEPSGRIWVFSLADRNLLRLPVSVEGRMPLLSQDGKYVAFSAPNGLYRKAVDTSEKEELLDSNPRVVNAHAWSPDGRNLLYLVLDQETKGDIWIVPLGTDRRPRPLLNAAFNELYPQISPDGRWLAYTSDETGSFEVWIASFPEPGIVRKISIDGGREPSWRADGRELYYLAPDDKLMTVDVQPGATLKFGAPRTLFQTRVSSGGRHHYAASDGERFLVDTVARSTEKLAITVVVNWTARIAR